MIKTDQVLNIIFMALIKYVFTTYKNYFYNFCAYKKAMWIKNDWINFVDKNDNFFLSFFKLLFHPLHVKIYFKIVLRRLNNMPIIKCLKIDFFQEFFLFFNIFHLKSFNFMKYVYTLLHYTKKSFKQIYIHNSLYFSTYFIYSHSVSRNLSIHC